MSQTLFEKLQLAEEKNLLIQGIPSAIEKQFVKLSFAKNVTPLLKAKKIDFALVFALNQRQLGQIMSEVMPALHEQAKLWVAYPKLASKIASDLNRDCSWNCLCEGGFEIVRSVALDHVWTALRFKKSEDIPAAVARAAAQSLATGAGTHGAEAPKADGLEGVAVAEAPNRKRTLTPPEDLEQLFTLHPKAKTFFDGLSFTNKKEYIVWITGAKKEDTRKRRLEATLEKLKAGKKNPSEK
jgi:hypothetical protein